MRISAMKNNRTLFMHGSACHMDFMPVIQQMLLKWAPHYAGTTKDQYFHVVSPLTGLSLHRYALYFFNIFLMVGMIFLLFTKIAASITSVSA